MKLAYKGTFFAFLLSLPEAALGGLRTARDLQEGDVDSQIAQCTTATSTVDYVTQLLALETERVTEAGAFYHPIDLAPFRQQLNAPFPITTDALPWSANVIPATYSTNNDDMVNGLPPTLSNVGHKKFPGLPYWMMAFNNLDPNTYTSDSDRNTLFLKNLEDRGPNNELKKQYMNALTCDKMQFYEPKIENAINTFLEKVTAGLPVMSTWDETVFQLYLDIHLGEVDHPQFVYDYMKDLRLMLSANAVGSIGGFRDLMAKASCANTFVEEYFEERRQAIVAAEDKSTYIFWWDKAGIPPKSLVFEAAHNVLAFGQHVNMLFLVVRSKLAGRFTIENLYEAEPFKVGGPIDFFGKYQEAETNSERIDVAREAYRILMPNSIWLSGIEAGPGSNDGKVIADSDFDKTNTFHWPFFIQGFNDEFNPLTGESAAGIYDTSRYEDFTPPDGCPFATNMETEDAERLFKVSPVDGETVVPKSHYKWLPVFEEPKYCPFGLGYRRCPAEIFNVFFLQKIFEGLGSTDWTLPPGVPPLALFAPLTPEDFAAAVPVGLSRVRDILFVPPAVL